MMHVFLKYRLISLRLAILMFAAMALGKQGVAQTESDIAQHYVNPFIGTKGDAQHDEGRTHPGAQVPFGMVSVCPFNAFDTTVTNNMWNRKRFQAPYFKNRTRISGFSHANISGVGCPDMGAIIVMPTTGKLQTQPVKYFSKYMNEVAQAGYYSVDLDRYAVHAEMSATERVGVSRYVFPEGQSNILINLGLAQTNIHGGSVKILSATQVEGSKNVGFFCGSNTAQTVYFAAEFSQPAKKKGVWNGARIFEENYNELSGNETGAFFSFDTRAGEAIEIKVGISYVSTQNAWLNLKTEAEGMNFQQVKTEAQNQWNAELSKIQVEGGSYDDKVIFYTALYHTLIHPNIFNDVNGEYPSMGNHQVMKAEGYNRYTVFSLWDTYRNLHPLLTLIYPERQLDMVKSMLAMYEESGWLPKWELVGNETSVMVGDPSLPVIADTYLKGIHQFDVQKAYTAMKKGASTPEEHNPLRPGIDAYLKYGYIPMDVETKRNVWGPVSTTLEYNMADFSLAQLARALGKTDDANLFLKRSHGYNNFFDPANNLLRPKLKDGSWLEPFDPACCTGYPGGPGFVEGTSWQYSFFVPHDIVGLMKLMGGKKVFTQKLQTCFDENYFSMSNEPDIAYPFLFNYVKGEEWRTQKEVQKAIAENFQNIPAGLPGNDDCGTMSAWLVFAMMGLYPDCPAVPHYQLTTPSFSKVTIQLSQDFYPGKQFVISTTNDASEDIYLKSIKLNGKKYRSYQISHEDVVKGGKLEFETNP